MVMKNKFLCTEVVLCGIAELLMMLFVFYFHYLCMDHAEHIHASWLVWQGKIPYRDFFEHHNPLLWFLMAPVTAAFYKKAIILYVCKVITALVYMIMFAGFYKICRRYLAVSGKAFALALCLYFLVCDHMFLFFELQPDPFMLAGFVWGLYYFFGYLEKKEQGDLSRAFVLFVISFLFLQKILLLLALLGGYSLWLLHQGKMRWKDIAFSAGYPLVLLVLFLMYLVYTYSLNLYLLLNYDLNFWMQKFSGEGRVLTDLRVTAMLPVAAVAVLRPFLADKNMYRHILCVLLFGGYLLKYFIGAPYPQYFMFDNLVSAVIIGDYILSSGAYWKRCLLFLLLFLTSIWVWRKYLPNRIFPSYVQAQQYVMDNTEKDDVLFNSFYFFFNIYGANPSYYWFGHGNIAEVAALVYDFEKGFDLNEALYKYRPRFFYLQHYPNMILRLNDNQSRFPDILAEVWEELPEKTRPDKDAFMAKWNSKYFQIFDYDFIERYYEQTMFSGLYMRRSFENQTLE